MGCKSCEHYLRFESAGFHPGGTCLRIETMTPAARCALKPTAHARARRINVVRWVLSGGSPIDVCHPCSACCPLEVAGEGGILNDRKRGPCPVCRTFSSREGLGPVRCRECGLEFNLV